MFLRAFLLLLAAAAVHAQTIPGAVVAKRAWFSPDSNHRCGQVIVVDTLRILL
jgi:hypothetical protein